MPILDSVPHVFLVIVVVVVAFFLLKSLIKFAIIIGGIGLVIYLVWVMDVFGRVSGRLATA